MKKILTSWQKKPLLPTFLIFSIIFLVSILALQVIKINAQVSSNKLSTNLDLMASAYIEQDLSVDGNLGLGIAPAYKLDVNGKSNVSGLVFANSPGNSQKTALATVSYINDRINSIRNIRPPSVRPNPNPGPEPDPEKICYWYEIPASCSASAPSYCEDGYSAFDWYIDNMGAGGCFLNTKCCN